MKNNKNFTIAFLVSGSGTNMQNVIENVNNHNIDVAAVIADRPCYAIERAEKLGIKNYVCDKKNNPSDNVQEHIKKIDEYLQIANAHLIILAGFLGILPQWFTQKYEKKIINVHPSLLPAYGGKGMYGKHVHKAVLENKEQHTGCTVHWVNEVVDGGDIIHQKKVEVAENETIESLIKKVQEAEHILLPQVVLELSKKYYKQGEL